MKKKLPDRFDQVYIQTYEGENDGLPPHHDNRADLEELIVGVTITGTSDFFLGMDPLTVDASKLYYLALKDCVLTTRDQLALSSCAWSISHLFVQNCNFDDYYLSLFLSKLDLTAYIDFQFHIFENFGPCASYEFARLLMKFHVAKAEDVEVVEVSLRVRWQTKLVDETHANHRRGWDYIHAAMRELSLACAGRREARIRSRIDIGTERNPLCLSYFHKIPMFVAWNEYSSEMYNSPCLRFENANRLADLASPARLSVDHGSAV